MARQTTDSVNYRKPVGISIVSLDGEPDYCSESAQSTDRGNLSDAMVWCQNGNNQLHRVEYEFIAEENPLLEATVPKGDQRIIDHILNWNMDL